MANTIFHAADSRGHAQHGWLNAYHTFSFAGYHDPERVHFGVLRVLNDDTIDGGNGFGKHPHDNMEIITIVLEGALEHQDNMGNKESIQAGEVQVMSAGTGVYHSEYNHNPDKKVKLFQVWMFPNKENVKPRYDQRLFNAADRVNTLQTIVSPIDKDDEGLKIHQDAWIYRTSLQSGKSVSHTLHSPQHGVYIMVVDGSVTINGQTLNKRDAIGISETDKIEITATADSDVLVYEVPMD